MRLIQMNANRQKKYILYGTGLEAENFLFRNQDLLDKIIYCIDRNKKEKFHGFDVYQLNKAIINKSKHFIIVAASDIKTFVEIKEKLCAIGMIEWDNFIWSKAFRRKLVIINANCHGAAIQKYLELSATFCNLYFVYPVPAVQVNEEKEISPELLKHTDVFIHQDIRTDNFIDYRLSDVYIRQQLSPNVVDICIPNFVGMGKWMFPNLGGLDKLLKTNTGLLNVTFRDYVLDEGVKICKTIEDYVKFWNNYKYDSHDLNQLFLKSINKMREREKNWSVKITSYIEKNYKSIPCFVDANHPSKYVICEVGRQVAKLLNLSDIDDEGCDVRMGIPVPILKNVSDNFELSFIVDIEQKEDWLGKRIMSPLEDYIRAYVWWYHEIILK